MALTATVTAFCAATIAAIRWLMVLGVVRVFHVETVTSAGSGYTTTSETGSAIGVGSHPSDVLTRLDHRCMKIVLFAGAFWMVRLALRTADRRIGFWRGVGILAGWGLLVAAGAMHFTAEAVAPRRFIARTNVAISLLAGLTVAGAFAMQAATNRGTFMTSEVTGLHATLEPFAWGAVAAALQLVVAVGGFAMATFLTAQWWLHPRRPAGRATAFVTA
jgi:hypothetical protein